MLCTERDDLLQQLIEAVQAYGHAIYDTVERDSELRDRAEAARHAYEDCRQALITHQLTHGCNGKGAHA